jgi:hypothetical protein
MSVAEPLAAPLRVGRRSNGMILTPEEFGAIDQWDKNYRYEHIRGVLIVSPPPNDVYQTDLLPGFELPIARIMAEA